MTDPDQFIANELKIRCSDAVELVTEYLDDALNDHDLANFETHLADCEGCTVFVDQIKMTIALTSATTRRHVEVMPANFDELTAILVERATEPE
ncbi:MAG: anti-sigma factor family protein [Acidimicrobiales bacterium]